MSSGRITIMRVGGASLSPVGVPALREQRVPSAPSFFAANEGRQDDNPFAPPPRDAPERPWQPRLPSEPHGAQGGAAPGGAPAGPPAGAPGSPAGDRWSSRQPEPRGGGGPSGPGPTPPPAPSGPRVDLTDPVQRRARYALLAGMWGLFFALFSIPEVGLLLGALALYWGFSALRGRAGGQASADGTQRAAALAAMESGPPRAATATPGAPEAWRPSAPVSPYPQRAPQTTAALSGIIAAFVALSVVAATYTFQLVYRDYYSCVSNALTQPAQQACTSLLPKALQPVLGPQNS